MLKVKKKNKIKWSSSQLTESNDYIRLFTKVLSEHLPPTERQAIYLISKFFVDATIEVKYNRLKSAEYLFSKGEKYMAEVPENSLTKKILINIYDRSKSLYFYRLGKHEKAIELIYSALSISKELEKIGFHFLVFDRLSQFHNLSRIYFSLHQPEKGLDVLSDIISALITGKPNKHIDELNHFVEKLDEEGLKMRSSFACMLLFETIEKLQGEQDLDTHIENGKSFFNTIAIASLNALLKTVTDQGLLEWIQIVKFFYERDFNQFQKESIEYLSAGKTFHGRNPSTLMLNYLTSIPSLY